MMEELCQTALQAPTADELLCAALDIGVQILKNGGEVHRVEDTIERIGRAFGAVHVEVFSVTSFIVASVRMQDGTASQQLRRVPHTRVCMRMIEDMNELSRALCDGRIPLSELRTHIAQAKRRRAYPLWVSLLAVILFGIGATVFMGGTLRDGACAALAGIPVFLLSRHKSNVNPMVMTVFSSFLAASVTLALVYIGLGENVGFAMAGTVMHLVPGLAFGNSLRDMLGGDTLSGMMRLFHTLLVALMLGLGFAAAIYLFGAVSTVGEHSTPWYFMITSGILFSVGYAVMNDLPARRLCWIAGGAVATVALYLIALPLGDFLTHLIAIFAVTIYSEVAARLAKAPVIGFLTASMIALVPGSLLYDTIYHYISGSFDMALTCGNRLLSVCFGIAAGILLGSLVAGFVLRRIAAHRARRTAK